MEMEKKLYSDLDFAHEVKNSIGNVKYMKKRLREIGKIGERQQLSDDFIEVFTTIKNYKDNNHTTWEHALDNVFKEIYGEAKKIDNNIEDESEIKDILKEILATLKRIEQKF